MVGHALKILQHLLKNFKVWLIIWVIKHLKITINPNFLENNDEIIKNYYYIYFEHVIILNKFFFYSFIGSTNEIIRYDQTLGKRELKKISKR